MLIEPQPTRSYKVEADLRVIRGLACRKGKASAYLNRNVFEGLCVQGQAEQYSDYCGKQHSTHPATPDPCSCE
jgi:hypothetical protein